MTTACYLDRKKADRWMRAFASGCGGRVVARGGRDPAANDHCVMGNWPVASQLIAEFKQTDTAFWYLDSGYIQTPGRRDLRVERSRFWPTLTPASTRWSGRWRWASSSSHGRPTGGMS